MEVATFASSFGESLSRLREAGICGAWNISVMTRTDKVLQRSQLLVFHPWTEPTEIHMLPATRSSRFRFSEPGLTIREVTSAATAYLFCSRSRNKLPTTFPFYHVSKNKWVPVVIVVTKPTEWSVTGWVSDRDFEAFQVTTLTDLEGEGDFHT